jgi:hypothetical protein
MRRIDITIQGLHQLPLESNKRTKNLESTRRQKEKPEKATKGGLVAPASPMQRRKQMIEQRRGSLKGNQEPPSFKNIPWLFAQIMAIRLGYTSSD